jgi:hypothetical protein
LREAGIDLAVLLSTAPETFSFTLSEVLSAGIPAIVSNTGALYERIESGVTGFAVADDAEAARVLERLARDPAELTRVKESTSRFRHRSIAEMAESYRALYRELWPELSAGGQIEDQPTVEERRSLFTAHRAAEGASEAPAGLRPLGFRETSIRPVLRRLAAWLPTKIGARLVPSDGHLDRAMVCGWSFGHGSVHQASSSGLRRLVAVGARAIYRATDGDPNIVCTPDPFASASVHRILFELRHRPAGDGVAQIYWTHGEDESFSEEKSVRIPLAATGEWCQYTINLDHPSLRAQWRAGRMIRAIRFDPVDHRGFVELRTMRFLA